MNIDTRSDDILDILQMVEQTELGDRHENQRIVEEAIQTRKENSVVVLGPIFSTLTGSRSTIFANTVV